MNEKLKEAFQIIDETIKEEAREEAKKILELSADYLLEEFISFHKKKQENICCLVLDRAKDILVKFDLMEQKKEDNFGKFFTLKA